MIMTKYLSNLVVPSFFCAFSVVGLGAPEALSSPCTTHEGGLRQGPVAVSFLEGDLGTPRRACPRSEAGFGAQGGVVFEPETYGLDVTAHIGSGSPLQASAAARVFGSLKLTDRLELYGSFQPINTKLIRSSFQSLYIGLGNTSVGASLVVYESGPFVLGVTGQATLPTAIGFYRNAWPVGLDSGLTFAFEPFPFFQLHGQLSGVGSVAITQAAFDPRAGMLQVIGGEFYILDWVSFVLDYNSLALMNAPLAWVAVAAGVRGRLYAGLGVEATVVVPIIGNDRHLAKARMSLSYRF